jgi:hypothetical protein
MTLVVAGGALEFVYKRAVEAVGELTFTVEWSDNLESDCWTDDDVVQAPLNTTGALQTIKATIPLSSDHPRRFVRLCVNR